MTSNLIINRRPPYSCQLARDALDAALASAAFGVETALLYMDDGVFQLKKEQTPLDGQLKRFTGLFESLSLYGLENVFVCYQDLDSRGLEPKDLVLPVTLLDNSEIALLFNRYDNLLTF